MSAAPEVPPSGLVSEAEAAEILAGRDHGLAGLIAQAGPMRSVAREELESLAALVLG